MANRIVLEINHSYKDAILIDQEDIIPLMGIFDRAMIVTHEDDNPYVTTDKKISYVLRNATVFEMKKTTDK